MARVSVTESRKPKPENTFKYLRRDEGRLSYTYSPGDVLGSTASPSPGSEKGGARESLRKAIAEDMRNRKSQDPFSDVVVAVPKRAPPSSVGQDSLELTGGSAPPSMSQNRKAIPRRREWEDVVPPPSSSSVPDDAPPREDRGSSALSGEYRDPVPHPIEREEHRQSRGSVGSVGEPYTAPNPYPTHHPASASPSASRRSDQEQDYGYGSYFSQPMVVGTSHRAEDQIAHQLEREVRTTQLERSQFLEARRDLEEERRRFQAFREAAKLDLENERARLMNERRGIEQDSLKSLRSLEERHRTVTNLLEQERESNRRLAHENDLLTSQLNELTTTMRETQGSQKAEITRLRRDVDSLMHRNKELLAMARQNQIDLLEPPLRQPSDDPRNTDVPPLQLVSSSLPYSHSGTNSSKNADDRYKISEHPPRSSQSVGSTMGFRNSDENLGYNGSRNAVGSMNLPGEASAASSGYAGVLKQRSGHPTKTPRMKGKDEASSNAIKGATSPAARKSSSSSVNSAKIPSREELLGPSEAMPALESPTDAVVSRNALGSNPNKREVLYRSGKREIHYSNGTSKTVLPSGHTVLHFVNGDVKRTYPSGRSTYWYDSAKTMHTQLPDGSQLFEFKATGQVERHLPNGEKHILYADGIYKKILSDGVEETLFPSKSTS